MQTIKDSIKTLIISLIVLALMSVAYAWTEPVSTPPSGNINSPINVGSEPQIKAGGLGVDSLDVLGGVKIGDVITSPTTDCPDLDGTLKYDGNFAGCINGKWIYITSVAVSTAPVVTTSAASDITSTLATLNGSANPKTLPTTGWFRYSATNPGSCNDTFGTRKPLSGGASLGSGTSAVNYSQSILGLTSGTTYYYCAIASNSKGTSFGSVMSFIASSTVVKAAPTVQTGAALTKNKSTVTLYGDANPNGELTIASFRYYGTTNPVSCNDFSGSVVGTTNLGNGTTIMSYTYDLGGLTPGATYYYCAIASNSKGSSVGLVRTATIQLAFGDHTASQCIAAGGTVEDAGSDVVCRISGSDPVPCPGGWKSYWENGKGSWLTTIDRTCNGTSITRSAAGTCTTSMSCTGTSVVAPGGSWGTISYVPKIYTTCYDYTSLGANTCGEIHDPEIMTWYRFYSSIYNSALGYYDRKFIGQYDGATCYPAVTQRGCY